MYTHKKYLPYGFDVDLSDREWPNRRIEKAPLWCSVDLRDGNQALPTPMSVEQKVEFFQILVEMGFKEIEVGFPSASETEFRLLRRLVDENLIPSDVKIQVLTQARPSLIKRTFEAIESVPHAIVHFYNSTSIAQRDYVFNSDKAGIKKIAEEGAKVIGELVAKCATPVTVQYSPESFTGTEREFSLEVCEAVCEILQPAMKNPIILNLPATVEMSTPNVYADLIEWFCRKISNRENRIISLHTHNDRGTGVAASELGLLAGADRIEGTLFGNGERTGNVDLVALGLNLYSQGVDPEIDFRSIKKITKIYKEITDLPIHPRHPYVGELVYTAFSGSHQDAIKKGLDRYRSEKRTNWDIPYLPIDPEDLEMSYEAVIRINSQSGKGGVAYILAEYFGYQIPKLMQPAFSQKIQKITDEKGVELSAKEIFEVFEKEYIESDKERLELLSYEIQDAYSKEKDSVSLSVRLNYQNEIISFSRTGEGVLQPLLEGMIESLKLDPSLSVLDYQEHTLESSVASEAITYVGVKDKRDVYWGVGVDKNITTASIKALIRAIEKVL